MGLTLWSKIFSEEISLCTCVLLHDKKKSQRALVNELCKSYGINIMYLALGKRFDPMSHWTLKIVVY